MSVRNDAIAEVVPGIIKFRQVVDRQVVIENVLACVTTD